MKRLVGYHHQIKTILLPVLKDLKKIKVINAGFTSEQVHATFSDKSIWVLKLNKNGDWVKSNQFKGATISD